MELQSYLRALRKRWRIIVGCTLIALSLAALLTLLTPKTYSSSIRFFVSTADASNNSQLAQGGTFTQDRVKSYTELMTTPRVLQPVADELKIKDGASSIEPKVVAKAAPDTVIIDTTVTDTNPNRAKAIATSLGTQFPKSVDELERVSDSKPSPVKVTLVQTPTKSEKVGPNWLTNLVLAGLLGLLAGTALALLRDRLDTKIRNKDDVEAAAEDITVLGAIPFDSDAPKHPLILEADPHSSRAEAFRSLRTNLQFVDAAKHPQVLTVTSSLAGEGKTTTTANLAFALANSGSSVCLIEGDLRRPRLLSYLGLEGGVGLTDVLIGRVALKDVAQRFGEHRLMVIGSGATPPNPSELLGSEPMKAVLDDLRGRFDYVVVDAPPLLPVTDAAVLSTQTDGTVLVAGADIVNRDQMLEALEMLDAVSANILGVVVNRVQRGSRGNYYNYRYESFENEEAPQADPEAKAVVEATWSGAGRTGGEPAPRRRRERLGR
ncbi:polysaccharide biosynthesis tyrosine autokinase [Dermacoccus abyssi]|uniref:Polysaccharide biosynthesis tyrosine autokinase n=1 Tax=Dermacoccus abyssi TaxID=322596 RepID=A0ABX5ZAK6_9MICO|nr:polysaccharide biosynthesis tyrosine autokinase [Dermacoccus abyssi]